MTIRYWLMKTEPTTFSIDDLADAKSDPENPRWFMVDIQLERKFDRPVTLAELRQRADLREMKLLQKGNRLSVQPVTQGEFETIEKLAGADGRIIDSV